MADFTPPEPKPGKRFELFKKPKARSFSASIVMTNGHREILDTGTPQRLKAAIAATSRVRVLYKELGIPTPADERKKRGELSPYRLRTLERKQQAAKGNGAEEEEEEADDSDAPPPAGQPTNGQGSEWQRRVLTMEQRYMLAFRKIEEMLLLGLNDDPAAFVEHLRAIVIQTLHGETLRRPGKPRGRPRKHQL